MAKKLVSLKTPGVHLTEDNLPELFASLKALAANEVLVGVPEENTDRPDEESQALELTNASLAYIHDNGAPEANIPARPFMIPGTEKVLPQCEQVMKKQAQYALQGNKQKAEEGFDRVGFLLVNSITTTIRSGIPPPLAEMTLRKRAARGRKGAQDELNWRRNGGVPSMKWAKPLQDTNEMLKSITYVKRPRKARSK